MGGPDQGQRRNGGLISSPSPSNRIRLSPNSTCLAPKSGKPDFGWRVGVGFTPRRGRACRPHPTSLRSTTLPKTGEGKTSPARHGANDLDRIAVAHRGGGPGRAPHHGAIERDGETARLGNFKLGGLIAPKFSEIGRRAIARFSVDGQLHVDIPVSYTPSLPSPACGGG